MPSPQNLEKMNAQIKQIIKDLLFLAAATSIVASGCLWAEGKIAKSAVTFCGAALMAAAADCRVGNGAGKGEGEGAGKK